MKNKILSKNPKHTFELGERLAKHLRPQDVICLFGPLGSGKTVLTKGVATGLGLKSNVVSSPTFTFLNIYDSACYMPNHFKRAKRIEKLPLYHFDLYRIEKTEDLQALGLDEFLYGQGVCVIEWAEKLGSLLPKECLEIKISHKGETSRQLAFSAKGKRAKELLKDLQ
ncbi:MAG: tRNA (adenosine(37)-N6)-threonylcarbamoyltransferase complex ATPase subunit type 1 TsaE [Candidatus Omnitrophota bacterium]